MSVAKIQSNVNGAKALGWDNSHAADLARTPDNFGVLVPPSHEVRSGKAGNPIVEEGLIPAQARVLLRPLHPISIYYFTALVSPNPVLVEAGVVSCPSVLTTGDDLLLSFTPHRAFDIKTLPWLVKVTFIS